MPATIPAHPAAVLPLKLLSPRRLDGVALVVGAAAPDLGYTVEGLGIEVRSHAWHSLAWFSLPLTLVITALVRRAAPVVAAHLPPGGPLAIRDYGVLATMRHPLRVTVWSALLGAASHLVWDSFTHPYIVVFDPFLGPDTPGLPWWRAVQLVSEVVGAAVSVSVAVHIGRHRLLLAWHGPAPVVAHRFVLFLVGRRRLIRDPGRRCACAPGQHPGPAERDRYPADHRWCHCSAVRGGRGKRVRLLADAPRERGCARRVPGRPTAPFVDGGRSAPVVHDGGRSAPECARRWSICRRFVGVSRRRIDHRLGLGVDGGRSTRSSSHYVRAPPA